MAGHGLAIDNTYSGEGCVVYWVVVSVVVTVVVGMVELEVVEVELVEEVAPVVVDD